MKITNINTISALLDRLITEKIKQYFFLVEGDNKAAKTQGEISEVICNEIKNTLTEAITSKKYDFVAEQRTYKKKVSNLTDSISDLIVMNLNVGKADHNLAEIINNLKLSRLSLEKRSKLKNNIDNLLKEII
jgi:macrodomain Ter protein organizer (MatP/YcbG family)